MENYPLGAAFLLLGTLVVVFHKQFIGKTIRFWSKIEKYSERETKFYYILGIFIGIVFIVGGILMIVRPDLVSGFKG